MGSRRWLEGVSVARQQSAFGHFSDMMRCLSVVRCALKSGHRQTLPNRPAALQAIYRKSRVFTLMLSMCRSGT